MLWQKLMRESQNIHKPLKILWTITLYIMILQKLYKAFEITKEKVPDDYGNWKVDKVQARYHNRAEIVCFKSLKQEVKILPKDFVHTLADKECQVDAAA